MSRVIFVIVVALVGCLMGCSDDCLDCPFLVPTLIGEYEGIYRYKVDDGTSSLVNDSQAVTVFITKSYFYMYLDASRTPASDRIACDVKAGYSVEGSLTLWYATNADSGQTSRNLTGLTCPDDRTPEGAFALQQPSDSVILVNQTISTNDETMLYVTRVIRLKHL